MTVGKRECSLCNKHFPEEVFASNGKTKTGRRRTRAWCKYCESKRVTAERRKNPYLYLTLLCPDCGDESYVRIAKSKEAGLHIYMCENCAEIRNRSQNGKQKEK